MKQQCVNQSSSSAQVRTKKAFRTENPRLFESVDASLAQSREGPASQRGMYMVFAQQFGKCTN